MKTLLLIRHAKSSWNDSSLPDIERPLNERGKHDAPVMAKKIIDKNVEIDAFVSSPAKRAKKTAELFMKAFNIDKEKLIIGPSLYEAPAKTFFVVIESLKDEFNSVAIFAHNPGITDFVNLLNCYPVYEMPTCAVFAIKIDTKKWEAFKDADKEFLFFDYPKNA